jgi:hypothetical protein
MYHALAGGAGRCQPARPPGGPRVVAYDPCSPDVIHDPLPVYRRPRDEAPVY